MNFTRKMMLTPIKSELHNTDEKRVNKNMNTLYLQEGSGSVETRRRNKLKDIIKIVYKLSKINAFNEQGKIRNKNGDFIENTDLSSLLTHILYPGRNVFGEEILVDLLNEANVDPLLIKNDYIKDKIKNNNVESNNYVKPVVRYNKGENIERLNESLNTPKKSTTKRKHEESFDEDEDVDLKKNKNFESEILNTPLKNNKRKFEDNKDEENDAKKNKFNGKEIINTPLTRGRKRQIEVQIVNDPNKRRKLAGEGIQGWLKLKKF
ncbi:MAG: hypothetical protein QM535_19315 [Limnohabitans sp.]|nr:hypothetical protein [Limnohabitans sp.]